MKAIMTESPNGFKVSITHYTSMGEAFEVEAQDTHGNSWSMWFDSPADFIFVAEVLNDYIEDHQLRPNKKE